MDINKIENSLGFITANRDELHASTFNLCLDNQALLVTIMGNQALIFEKLFPEKTVEEHYNSFVAKYETLKTELTIKAMQDFSPK